MQPTAKETNGTRYAKQTGFLRLGWRVFLSYWENTLCPILWLKSQNLTHNSSKGKAICKFSGYWVSGQHLPVNVSTRIHVHNTECLDYVIWNTYSPLKGIQMFTQAYYCRFTLCNTTLKMMHFHGCLCSKFVYWILVYSFLLLRGCRFLKVPDLNTTALNQTTTGCKSH